MGVQVLNPIPVGEVPAWLTTLSTTFLRDYRGEAAERRAAARALNWIPERAWGAREAGRWVATLATQPRRLTLPGGGELVADALTNVTVNATHRRRGLLTTMLGASLDATRVRGEAVSILVAAEWPIYGRFGYAPATQYADYTFRVGHPRALIRPAESGVVRQVEADEFRAAANAVFDGQRLLRAGQVDRDGDWWDRELGTAGVLRPDDGPLGNLFLHETDGVADGLLAWKPKTDFDLDGTLGSIEVRTLTAASDVAYRNLWAYLSALDVIDRIDLGLRPVDEPVRWLLPDGRALLQRYAGDHVWVRLLDVPAALAARGYGSDGRLVLDVVDGDHGGYAAGRYVLEVDTGAVRCERTTEPAHLRVSQRVLAGVYLGAYSFSQLRAMGIEELDTAAVQRADALFSTPVPPWNATAF
jgi:predicted acetyltransferase